MWVLKEIFTSPPPTLPKRAHALPTNQHAQLFLIPVNCFLLLFVLAVKKYPLDIKEGRPTRNYYKISNHGGNKLDRTRVDGMDPPGPKHRAVSSA